MTPRTTERAERSDDKEVPLLRTRNERPKPSHSADGGQPTRHIGARWDGQLLNLFPCHIEVAKDGRTVANLRKLRRKVSCLRTIRVLHCGLVRRKLHN